jgi:hypothetical protein
VPAGTRTRAGRRAERRGACSAARTSLGFDRDSIREYKTEILTSLVGRDKLRINDLDSALTKYGNEGWELVSVNLDADLKGSRDGHLLVFKRPEGVEHEGAEFAFARANFVSA